MTTAPHRLGEVLDNLEHALAAHPGFSCHGADVPCPNGRYVVDHASAVIYLDRSMTGDEAFQAFVEACVELDADAAYRDVASCRDLNGR